MGKKIFVSYKYGDTNVHSLKLPFSEIIEPTKVRDYIDKLQDILDGDDHINKGEADGEDLSNFKDSTIESKLRGKIYDSSVTIVAISPSMKNIFDLESEQWIPWEISYSLKEHTRNGRTSKANAILAVIIPDKNNSYDYFIEDKSCCDSGCRLFKTNTLFKILSNNMFNIKDPNSNECSSGSTIYYGDSSYIHSVKWSDFVSSPNYYIDKAISINDNIDNYDIVKTITI